MLTTINTELLQPGNVDYSLASRGVVLFDVDWGDGNIQTGQTSNSLLHTYSSPGIYTITVSPTGAYAPYPASSNDSRQITDVSWVNGAAFNFGTEPISWFNSINMENFDFVNTSGVLDMRTAWYNCTGITSFPSIDTSSVADFTQAWLGCSGLTSFPLIDVSSATSLSNTWSSCGGLNSFPLINTSSVTLMTSTWQFCIGLVSFPSIDLSNVTQLRDTWRECTNLTSFPSVSFSSITSLIRAWYKCSSLVDFPANVFDTTGTLTSAAFISAFNGCALSAQSIENILVSLDTNGQSNSQLDVSGGTNASQSTWSSRATGSLVSLQSKGWTISYNP